MDASCTRRLDLRYLGLALCVALLSGCSGPAPYLRMELPHDHEWDAWSTGEDSRRTQHLPVGETMEGWTERGVARPCSCRVGGVAAALVVEPRF